MKKAMWAFAALALAGCQTPGAAGAGAEPAKEFKAEGEVNYMGQSASFDDTRVFAPRASLSKRSDGSWAGRFMGAQRGQDLVVDVDQHGTSLKGVDFILSWEESPTGVTITSNLSGKLHHIDVNDQYVEVSGGDGSNSFKLARHDRENFGTGNFHLSGKATEVHPPEPQFALMMLAAFN